MIKFFKEVTKESITNNISVIISTWKEDKLEYLKEAIKSILLQSLLPREVIIVIDGPINPLSRKWIEELWHKNVTIRKIWLPKNVGRGMARNIGINIARFPFIAIMDSDDIALKNRLLYEKIFLDRHREIDCVFAWQEEFDNFTKEVIGIKKAPEFHDDIVKKMKFRCILSNPTLMARKEALISVGGYCNYKYIHEDTCLFTKLILKGYKFYVIQEPLLRVRITPNQRKRRSGLKLFYEDLKLKFFQYKLKFIRLDEFVFHVIIYFFFRISPIFIKNFIYFLIRK